MHPPSFFSYNKYPLVKNKPFIQLRLDKIKFLYIFCTIIHYFISKRKKPKWFKVWREQGAKKVVVRVNSLEDLYRLKDEAEELGLTAEIIKDAGLTEVPPGTETVLGIGPGPSNIIDKITGNLPLL